MTQIQRLVHMLGIPGTYLGLRYLVFAVMLAMQNEDRLLCITRCLYEPIAKEFGTTIACVEKNLRTVVNVCWARNRPMLERLAGYPLCHKPRTGELIDILVTYLKRHC